jgi:hypothetical protein
VRSGFAAFGVLCNSIACPVSAGNVMKVRFEPESAEVASRELLISELAVELAPINFPGTLVIAHYFPVAPVHLKLALDDGRTFVRSVPASEYFAKNAMELLRQKLAALFTAAERSCARHRTD